MSEAVSPAGKSQMLEIVLGSGPSVLAPLGIEPAPLEPIAPATTPWLVVPDERALRRLLAPDGHGCIVSQARVLTVERLLAECMGFISMPPQMPTAVERFLLMGSIAKAANKVPNSGMIATMLEVDRLGHEAVAPTWMASLIGRYREELSSRGKCSHRERLRLVLEELRSGPGSLLVRHLRAMVGFVRIEGFGFMDGDLAMLAQAMSENVRVEIRMDHPTDKTELELLILHFSDSLKIEPKGLCAIPAPAPLYAVTPSVVRLRQSFQQPLWVASKVMDILNASDHFPSVAVVVPSSAHAEKVRLALELAGMPVSCPAESTMPWDTRPGQFVNRILDFPAMPFLADIDRIVGDPWARESFKNFWLWPTLRRICGEYRTGLSPDGWKDFFISALEKWAEDDGTSEAEDEGKDLAKRSISAAFASQMELAETDHEANHPRSDGTGAAETEEPAQVTSKHGKAVQMAALAADLVMVMGMAARAKADLPSSPDGPRELARRLGALLDRIGISKRLSGFRRGALPAGAMETDQKAAAKIREALKGLFRADILPETLGADQAINLAMAAQRVRLSPKDSGCVQVLSPAMAAAESFDHVIVIGLESGCYESSLPDQALCPPIERKRVRNQLASQLKSTCRQARRNAWLVWSEADKEQKQVKGCFLDEIEATFGTRRLPELVPDEVVLHRKPVDSFRVENARAWSERLDRLSRHLATSASLSGRPSWLPRVMELAWPSSRHFSPTRLQN
ncbi:MAG: hypothetical protein FJ308_10035, partial [Planctomycetes bacterium]|nr:hypothetical protein [Planctomycetota bacterium]